MQYPLEEKIGKPYLFVEREREFRKFGQWVANMPEKLSKSRVILARRKSGKTALVQRLFNHVWSANGQVIPFYFSVPEHKIWYPHFAKLYYRTFASQYISFLERDATLMRSPLFLEQIKEYGESHGLKLLVHGVEAMTLGEQQRDFTMMWEAAYNAPHQFGSVYDQRILVIIDEFQYLSNHIYRDEACQGKPDETMPGSYHTVSESKVAPMLVTGSYISWLLEIASQYLEAGRLSKWYMEPNLTPEEGLEAVYRYAEVYQQPITNESALMVNQLCRSDPFFISCVIQSDYEGKRLDTLDGVVNTVNYELTNRTSEMSETWGEYIYRNLSRINDLHGKQILLHLSKHNERSWTHRELKEALGLDLSLEDILRRLQLLLQADLIMDGGSDIDYQGLQDGTLYLVLRSRFEKEISSFVPDFRRDFRAEIEQLQQDKRQLQGRLNQVSGKMAEYQLMTLFRSEKRFALSHYFEAVTDPTPLNIIEVKSNVKFQRGDGKLMEVDVWARSSDGREVLVEVKKRAEKSSVTMVEDFIEKVNVYRELHPQVGVLAGFLSLGGFTVEAQTHCLQHGIGLATQLPW